MPWRLEIPRTPCSSLHSMLYSVQPREIYVQLEYCLVILLSYIRKDLLGSIWGRLTQTSCRPKCLLPWQKKKKECKQMPKVTLLVFAFMIILAIWCAEILLGFKKTHSQSFANQTHLFRFQLFKHLRIFLQNKNI